MSLYHKYRPQSFDEIIGNDQVVKSVQGMLEKEDKPHTYLLSGPRGCGKTTIARIISKAVGAVGFDVKEINAADFTGIDTIREIRRQAGFKPIEGKSKIWIIDESHRLSANAQDAFLKILEDSPSHVYFVLCTTEVQKLLATVKSRCVQFQLSPLDQQRTFLLLRKIVKAEGESIDREVYVQIAQNSFGHPRDAIQILEQVLSVGEKHRLEVSKNASGTYSESIDLCRSLVSKKTGWKEVCEIINKLNSQDYESIRRHIMAYCSKILLSGRQDNSIAAIMEEFSSPIYTKPDLVIACYRLMCGS